ncbi:hypothetical protein C0993_006058 [Termitomyces sp. T159_Od127]|nr:hypothetical protein C0993_006058 [Termitomyces sp. T159_Od127]
MTSSLTGAIGDSVHRGSRSPSVRNDGLHNSNWTSSQSAMLQGLSHSPYPGFTGMIDMTYDMSVSNISFDSTTMRDSSPESSSSGSPSFGNMMFDPYPGMRHHGSSYPLPTQSLHPPVSEEDQLRAELLALRQKLREVEAEAARYRVALEELRTKEMAQRPFLPTPPPSASFQEDWKARTELRTKIFCSLNRAGNALCAWHDSRRERRSFPPRNAPPGYLNCGCTHEEALFEESLARHGVGSYYPGESVRMDPALRNPLLKLLQQRYGYQDGDFERHSVTGEWLKGEGAAYWQAQIHAGSSSRRRIETERH